MVYSFIILLLSFRGGLLWRFVTYSWRSVTYRSIPFRSMSSRGMYRGMESRSVRQIKYVFHLAALLQFRCSCFPSCLLLHLSFCFSFISASVAVDFLAKPMFLFSCCAPPKMFFFCSFIFSADCFVLCSEAQKNIIFGIL